uniref:Uncharacterized protein n=1 Tax=Anguilla anguilla TaxID=7936 RepID=A0A0E9R1N2_ANGAN
MVRYWHTFGYCWFYLVAMTEYKFLVVKECFYECPDRHYTDETARRACLVNRGQAPRR